MKKLFLLLLNIFRSRRPIFDAADDSLWEHLDGAEFTVVPPVVRPSSGLD